ncbi:MAG: thiamine phosphate synthase [Pseudomonadota bacterium]
MENAPAPACRLYLITPPSLPDLDEFADAFSAALRAGDIACVQLRLKAPDGGPPHADDVRAAAARLAPLAQDAGAAFLINDDPQLAKETSADGVHIGQSDARLVDARAMLGPDASIGVTCHNSLDLAFEAGEAGADYVAFGAFFETATKEAPTRADPDILTRWREMTVLPSVAIGGVTPENGAALVRAGADFLAVSAAVWRNPLGPAKAIKAFETMIADAVG